MLPWRGGIRHYCFPPSRTVTCLRDCPHTRAVPLCLLRRGLAILTLRCVPRFFYFCFVSLASHLQAASSPQTHTYIQFIDHPHMAAGAAVSGLSPSPHNPRKNADAPSPLAGLSASPIQDRGSRSLSSTLSSRSRTHFAQTPSDRVPLSVAALAALPAAERIRVEHQFLEDQRKIQLSRPSSGRTPTAAASTQAQRRQQQETEERNKVLEEHKRQEVRQAAAEARKQNSGKASPKSKPSPWVSAPEHRSQFQMWNREGSLPQFVVSTAHSSRAPAVGTYGKSTSIELSTPNSPHIGLSTPRCGSCNKMETTAL